MSGLTPAQDVIERGLSVAEGDAVILVVEGSEADVRFANNTVTTNGVRRSRQVSVVVTRQVSGGTAVGTASGSGEVDVEALVRDATTRARGSGAAPDAAPFVSGGVDADFGDAPLETGLDALAPVLDHLRAVLEGGEAKGVKMAGFTRHAYDTTYLGTSSGLRRRFVQPEGAVKLNGRADGGKRSSWVGMGTPDFTDVNFLAMEAEIYRRLQWATREIDLPAGRYETIMPATTAADMMSYLAFSLDGQDAEDGRSVFSRPGGGIRYGHQLSPLPFQVYSDPHAAGLTTRPFVATGTSRGAESVFDNGFPLAPTTWIDKGTLANVHLSRAAAARLGRTATPAIDNLIVELPGSTATVDEMVANTERGLLLTTLWYIRVVDPGTLLLTGLTRDGVFLVENGSVVGQVNNFRFNESPVDLLSRATEAGAAVRTLSRENGEYLNRTIACPLRIPDFNMSSVSPAS